MITKSFKPLQTVHLAAILWLGLADYTVKANLFVSNLDDLWTSGGIGDIHAIPPGGAPFNADFVSGSGSFTLNAITLEFTGPSANEWNNVVVQIYQYFRTGNVLIGAMGSPVVDPKLTQWPQSANPNAYTTYIDFSSVGSITLQPHTEYLVNVSVPSSSPTWAGLLFTLPAAPYSTPTDWQMWPTTSSNPYVDHEFLKLAVDATLIPEPSTAALLLGGNVLVLIWSKRVATHTP